MGIDRRPKKKPVPKPGEAGYKAWKKQRKWEDMLLRKSGGVPDASWLKRGRQG